MFKVDDFDIFAIEGLEERMSAIRTTIQPIFQELDDWFVAELTPLIGNKLPIHIAQHRRRTAYAPDFTWSAMGGDNRGYKKYPHFQLGITGEYIVMWLSFIDNPEYEGEMADTFLKNLEWFDQLPKDTKLNVDHTKNNYHELDENELIKALERWKQVKKGEFQIGRIITKDDKMLQDAHVTKQYMLETYQSLVPLYLEAMKVRDNQL
ncbi:MAG: DUF1054 family protein [Vagococcus sp.]